MRADRAWRAFYAGVAGLLLGTLALVNARAYDPGGLDTVRAQLRFLERALEDGAAFGMQEVFPEGYVFTWALYGVASAQVAEQLRTDDPARAHYLSEARRSVLAVRTDSARASFVREMHPPYGAFYSSWSLYALAVYARALGPGSLEPELIRTLEQEGDRFAEALAASPTPFLHSYPNQSWPADTSVGIAALAIHDQVLPSRYGEAVERWVERARAHLEPTLGALAHGASPADGSPWGGVRGSSLALMSRVLVDADLVFAREQYRILRDSFVDRRAGFPGIREYPHGVSGAGDVDSGPLLLGFSGPAVVVGAGAAAAHGDTALAAALRGTIEVVGLPVQFGGSRRYGAGLVPIGDAFIAWAWSSAAQPDAPPALWSRLVPTRWAVPMHFVAAILAILILMRVAMLYRAVGRRTGLRDPRSATTE